MSRKDIAKLTATITGHWHIGTHAMKAGVLTNTAVAV